MSIERWQIVKDILYSVIEIAPQDRDSFLEKQCSSDQSLIKEIKSLLELEKQATGFLEKPIHNVNPQALSQKNIDHTISDNSDNSDNVKSADTLIGRTLGEFFIQEKIGEGGFGLVYKAEQVTLARDVVIKVLHTKHQSNQQVIKRFKQEAYLASRLEHPYAAHIYAFGVEDNGLMWIAMEMVNGTPLNKYLESNGAIALDRFIPLLDKICEVIHSAHEQNIIHRDIKPANVMLIVRAGRLLPKLLDFGIAKIIDNNNQSLTSKTKSVEENKNTEKIKDFNSNNLSNSLTLSESSLSSDTLMGISNIEVTASIAPMIMSERGNTFQTRGMIGSPAYMSPEQWQNTFIDTRSDIYALGVLTYKALTGKVPFTGKTHFELAQAHLNDNMPPLHQSYPVELNKVLAKAMAKKPEERYATAIEFASALREAVGYSEQQISLLQLPETLHDNLLASAPNPIAEAVSKLGTARNIHQARDLALDIFRTTMRYITMISLACCVQTGQNNHLDLKQSIELLQSIRNQQRLTEKEWFKLTQQIIFPFVKNRDLFPIPELVNLFFQIDSDNKSQTVQIIEEIIEMQESVFMSASTTEIQVRQWLSSFMPIFTSFLQAVSFLISYQLVLPQTDYVESWMGVAKAKNILFLNNKIKIEKGKALLIDAQKNPILLLWPLVLISSPSPEIDKHVFFLEGNGRYGAKFVALPSGFELQDESFWDWFGENFLKTKNTLKLTSLIERNPYLGLSTFTSTDADIFFGREREVESFINRMRLHSLLVVAGSSGAGKSSFIQAGIIPNLTNYESITIRPGARPIANLTTSLIKKGIETEDLFSSLNQNPDTLGNILRHASVKNNQTILLIVDQFEEVFTLCLDESERNLFSIGLAHTTNLAEERVKLIIVLRDDFLIRARELPQLGKLVTQGLELLTTPSSNDLVRVLIEPARRVGYKFEDEQMPVEIVESIAGRPSALPLLAFFAVQLWNIRDRQFQLFRRKTYNSMGGVGGTLASHAEEVLEQLFQEERKIVREVFRRLVTSEGTRAVLTKQELMQILGNTSHAETLLEKLISARLLSAYEGEGGIDSIEIVHEVLLSTWPRLVRWKQEDEEGARLRDQLLAAARQWQERGRPKGLLWRDDALLDYELWRSRYSGQLTETESAFASESLKEKTKSKLRTRILLSVAATILVSFSIISYWQYWQTKKQTLNLYEEQGRQELLLGNFDRALVYLSAAYSGGNDKPSLRFLIGQALQRFNKKNNTSFKGHTGMVFSASFSPNSKKIVSASADHNANIWEVSTGKLLLSLGHTNSVTSAVFSPDGKKIATASFDGTARIWDSETGKLLTTLLGHKGKINSVAFDHSGKQIITAGLDGYAIIWNSDDGQISTKLAHQYNVTSASFNPDDSSIITTGNDYIARLWDVSGKEIAKLKGHTDLINSAVFSPDNKLLVTASSDNSAKIWDARTGTFLRNLEGHSSVITSVSFSPNGLQTATSSIDRTVRIWDTEKGNPLVILEAQDYPFNHITFSPNGLYLAAASEDYTIKIWDVSLEQQSASKVAEIVAQKVPLRFLAGAIIPPTENLSQNNKDSNLNSKNSISVNNNFSLPSSRLIELTAYQFDTIKIGANGEIIEKNKGQAQSFSEDLGNGIKLDMVAIPSGTFLMGANQKEDGAYPEEYPQHQVSVEAFYLGKFEITQAQWKAIMNDNPSYFQGDNLPVETFTWYDAMEFCYRLSQKTGHLYRLPTEAEWEYACRAGTSTPFSFGETINSEFFNYDGNNPYGRVPRTIYRKKTVPVGSLGIANGFGLYDMHGNVDEWCLDRDLNIENKSYAGAPTNGTAWMESAREKAFHMTRGGPYNVGASNCRCAYRPSEYPDTIVAYHGLRVVMQKQ